jgi:hypothetical protein
VGTKEFAVPLEDADEPLLELVLLGLDHGIDSIRDSGGPLVPFVITEGEAGRDVHRFVDERSDVALKKAYEFVRRRLPDCIRAAVVHDGFTTIDGVRNDAVLALGCMNGNAETFLFAQRYSPTALLRGFRTIGHPTYLGKGSVTIE